MRRGHFIIRKWEIDYQIMTPPTSHLLEDSFIQETFKLYHLIIPSSSLLQPGNIRNHDNLCLEGKTEERKRRKIRKMIKKKENKQTNKQ